MGAGAAQPQRVAPFEKQTTQQVTRKPPLLPRCPQGRYNDLHRLDLERMTWTKVQVNGKPPSVRSHHAAVVLRDRMYVFGGADEERVEEPADNFGTQLLKSLNVAEAQFRDVMHNDLHEFNFLTCSWRVVEVSDLSPTPPPEGGITARLAVHEDLLYVLGWRPAREGDPPATVVDGQVLEVHVLDPQLRYRGGGRGDGLPAWQLVHFRGNAPQPRDLFACAVWKDSWILHGGRSARGDLLRDTFVFSFKTRAWKLLLAKSRGGQNVPDHRYSHQACVLDDVFLVVGGSNSAQYIGGANRTLAQRCSGVEMLYLARVVEPPPDYAPPVQRAPPPARKEPVWRSNFHRFLWELWMFLRAFLPLGDADEAARQAAAAGRGVTVSDVDLLVEGRRFHAHSRVLDRQSERFAAILARDPVATAADRAFAPALALQERVNRLGVPSLVVSVYYLLLVWRAAVTLIIAAKQRLLPSASRTIVVKDVSYEIMLIMMHFMYAGFEDRPGIPTSRLEEAFLAAERYGVYSMRAEALRLMIKGLAVNNVSQYALLAHENACQELWDACVEFCADRLPEIVNSQGFTLLWGINARVAQMLTGDAVRRRLAPLARSWLAPGARPCLWACSQLRALNDASLRPPRRRASCTSWPGPSPAGLPTPSTPRSRGGRRRPGPGAGA